MTPPHRTHEPLPKLPEKHTCTHTHTVLKECLPEKGLPPKNIPVVQAMFSLPQQIYTVVSDGLGFLLKRSPPIINSMAADTARHLHGSLTLQDCSQGLGGGRVGLGMVDEETTRPADRLVGSCCVCRRCNQSVLRSG